MGMNNFRSLKNNSFMQLKLNIEYIPRKHLGNIQTDLTYLDTPAIGIFKFLF